MHHDIRRHAGATVSGMPPVSLIETCIENGQRVLLINRDGLVGAECVLVENEAAAAELGTDVRIGRAGPASYATGAEGAWQLLVASSRPDGVFCATDLLALGFMDVARQEFRLGIPDDLCIIGFDDIPQAGRLG